MRLLFAGTPDTAVPSLDALLASRHEVVAVLTRADAPAGRGRRLVPSPVRRRAEEAGVPVLTDRPRGEEFLATLRDLDVDAAPVVAYGEILRPDVLAVPPGAEIAPGLFESELRHLVAHEWACSADDVLWRRSKLGLHYTPAQREAVAAWFGNL